MKKNKNSNVIKYTCDKCCYIKPYTKKELLIKQLFSIPKSLFLVLGFFTFIALLVVGPATVFGLYGSSMLTYNTNLDSNYLRQLSINATSNCDGDMNTYSYCYASNIYEELDSLRYVPASQYKLLNSAENTYFYGGDCKHMSQLYVAMLKSVGFSAQVLCKEDHCVAYVPHYDNYKRLPGFLIVDLTLPAVFLMEDGVPAWSYKEKGLVIK